ncbi:MAG: FAD-binding oxidoreductase [Chloroflexi bacterium]|nr:FAD-binding oxidoreductase [Chloroflexota bacterium]
MNRRDKLEEIVGVENFSDDPKALESYANDFSLQPAGVPDYAVKPKDTQEVQKVIKLANEHSLPVVPVSSWVHFYGATIPKKGGIILDLTRMNRIFEVDEVNRRVRMEAGVTWEQLTSLLAKKGFRVMMPLLPHPQRSVVTDTLEREVITNTVYDYGEPMQSMEVVWPNGEVFRTGSASVTGYPDSPSKGANPSGPGLDFYRFLQSAQGTMGVVTWANLKTEYLTQKDKMFLAPVKDLNRVMEFLYRILRIRIGQECLLLNSTDLAAIMATDMKKDFASLRSSLPPWTLILVISGHFRNPEGKIKYEEKALNEIIKNEFPEISFSNNLPGLPGSPMLAPKFVEKMESLASRHGYPVSDLGSYIQPIEHNRACQLEFNLFYDPASRPEVERVRTLASQVAKTLLDQGALFSRPYGELAKLVYDRANGYAATLKRVKKLFDPNNIMNPGNLCF